MPNVRLDHCVVHVSDWRRSNTFYRDVLGAELVRAGAGWSYRFGAQQLNAHGPGVDAAPVARVAMPPGGSDLCFERPGQSRTQNGTSGVTASKWRWALPSAAGPGASEEPLLQGPRRLAPGVHLV